MRTCVCHWVAICAGNNQQRYFRLFRWCAVSRCSDNLTQCVRLCNRIFISVGNPTVQPCIARACSSRRAPGGATPDCFQPSGKLACLAKGSSFIRILRAPRTQVEPTSHKQRFRYQCVLLSVIRQMRANPMPSRPTSNPFVAGDDVTVLWLEIFASWLRCRSFYS